VLNCAGTDGFIYAEDFIISLKDISCKCVIGINSQRVPCIAEYGDEFK
jgi:hypothetical protein